VEDVRGFFVGQPEILSSARNFQASWNIFLGLLQINFNFWLAWKKILNFFQHWPDFLGSDESFF
jgi:hypothetical protein